MEDELEVAVSGLFGRLVETVDATAADIMLTDRRSMTRKRTRETRREGLRAYVTREWTGWQCAQEREETKY